MMMKFCMKTKENRPLSSSAGFTLLELLIAIALIGILAVVALPEFRSWRQNSDLNADLRNFYGFLQAARMEAISRNANSAVTFGQVVGGVTFDFVAFVDTNANQALDAGEMVTRSEDLGDTVTISANTLATNGAGLPVLSYNARGLPVAGGGQVTLQGATGRRFDVVIHPVTGRVRID